MRVLLSTVILVLVFCLCAYSADIAYYVGEPNVDGWYTVAEMKKNVETMKNLTNKVFRNLAMTSWLILPNGRKLGQTIKSWIFSGLMVVSLVHFIHSQIKNLMALSLKNFLMVEIWL
ncbi:MAG: hypothetical protein ACPL7B_12595 [Candidatus Poribacteria bacterium]